MRLTLRTLLAYRDGVLSPSETADLHQRIRQTEVANNLLRRVDNLVKNKQLLAPKLHGDGLGGDANSVAEYLDDTLASEQVPEFERICIAESDLVLAELSHCHQLLAEAMSSEVVVSEALRLLAVSLTSPQNQAALQRRLKIGKKVPKSARPTGSIRRVDDVHSEKLVQAVEVKAEEATAAQRLQVQAPMVASAGGSIKPKGLDLERPQLAHEVPEYLVGQRGGGWRTLLAIGAMLALLSVIAWQALGPLSNVRELLVANNPVPNEPIGNGNTDNSVAGDATPQKVEPVADKPKVDSVASKPGPTPTANDSNDTTQNGTTQNDPMQNAPSLESELPITEVPKLSDAPNDAPNSETALPQTDSSTIRWTPNAEDAKAVLFARNMTDEKSLTRIMPNTPIPQDVEIVVPPSMRPTLSLAGQCTWSVCGPTLMQVSQAENVTISTLLCRAIAKGGATGHDLTIVAPTGPVKIKFGDATSMAAIEVAHRPVAHGAVTDKLVFKPFLIVVAVEGQVTVTATREATESKSIRLVVGEGVAFTDGQPIEFELGTIPSWYRAGNDRPLDVLAAADMHRALGDSDDAAAKLNSLCADTRPETAALAIQSKVLMGDWSDFAGDFLSNDAMRSHWSATIGVAEQMIASKEQQAETLRTALETAHPGRGEALFTLLVGAADVSQPKELLTKLLESLSSGELDERVLAAHQLRRLVGKDLGFQPSILNRTVLQQVRRLITSNPMLTPIDNPLWESKLP